MTGVCFAHLGNEVTCVDNDEKKIGVLKTGKVPFYEPGLEELLKENLKKVYFTTSIAEGVERGELIFIAVPTPAKPDGEADLCYVEAVSREIAEALKDYRLIVEKSTVPVETGKWIKHILQSYGKEGKFDVASNPEFLREGQAVHDFLHPDRIVLGVENERAKKVLLELYKPISAPVIVTELSSAEIIKHAANCFLALKISYINAIANICELVGGDVAKVAEGMGLDSRIRRDFLNAGIGWGGSCFPKDVNAFIRIAAKSNYNFKLLKAAREINRQQVDSVIKKASENLWNLKNKTIGVLGLSFKPDTDDIRESPAIGVVKRLLAAGARIKAYDPQAMEEARKVLSGVEFCRGPEEVASQSDALLILTAWEEFKNLPMGKIKNLLKNPLIIDGRNMFDPQEMKSLGITYVSIGRKTT